MDIDALRIGARSRVADVRGWALRMLDVVPGLRRLVNELVRVEVIDRAMVIAAQGLLALVPLLIVLAAFVPHELGVYVLDRFQSATGVNAVETRSVRGTLTADQVRSQTGFVGLLITLFSATSFGRSIQRMYERTWNKRHIGGLSGARRCFLWLVGWLLLLQLLGLLGSALEDDGAPTLFRVLVHAVAATVLWTWTARLLLLGRVAWRLLVPGAVITTIASQVYTGASSVVMPRYVATSSDQLGVLGLVLAATTWLIGFAFILVVAAVVGRVLSEDERVHAAVLSLLPGRLRRWAGQQLEEEQHQQGAADQDERERAGRMGGEDVDE